MSHFIVASGAPYINATLVSVVKKPCNSQCVYLYTIQYDEDDLVNPNTFLTQDEITSVICRDCLTEYIDWNVAVHNDGLPNEAIDTDSINLTLTTTLNRTIQADVRVSLDEDNIISITPDGLFAEETPNAVIDTETVNLTLSGTLNRTIQADVKVSAIADNAIEINADGLYVGLPTQVAECPSDYFVGA